MTGLLFILFNISFIYGYELAPLKVPMGFSHEVVLEPGDEKSLQLCSAKKLSFRRPNVYPNIAKNLVYLSKSDRTSTPLNSLIKGDAFSFDTSDLKSCVIRMKYRDDVPLTATKSKVKFLFYYDAGAENLSEFNKKFIHITLIMKDMYNHGCDFSFSGILKQSTIVNLSDSNGYALKKNNNNSNNRYSNINRKPTRKWSIMNLFKIFYKPKKTTIVPQKQRIIPDVNKVLGKERISKICSISLKTLPSRSFSFYCPGHLYPPNCFEEVYTRKDDGSFGYQKINGARTVFGRFTRKIRVKNISSSFKRGMCKCIVGDAVYLMDVEA